MTSPSSERADLEIFDVSTLPAEPSHAEPAMPAQEARERTDRLRVALHATTAEIRELWNRRVWVNLGYSDFMTYWREEFQQAPPKLPPGQRQAAVVELHQAGMPQTHIAPVLGVGQATVSRDLDAADRKARDSGEPTVRVEAVIDGRGRARPSTSTKPKPKPKTQSTKTEAGDDVEAVEVADVVESLPFEEEWRQQVDQLAKVLDGITYLVGDPQFERKLPDLTKEYHDEFERLLTAIGDVYERFL